jgi:hypothetical protein
MLLLLFLLTFKTVLIFLNAAPIIYMDDLLVPWSDESSITLSEAAYRDAGFAKTVGSVFIFGGENQPPFPSDQDLIQAFEQLNTPNGPSVLTVGAKALCKHYEREGPLKITGTRNTAKNYTANVHPFWKKPVGSEANKNIIARSHLDELLESKNPWKNIHNINPETIVLEMRERSSMYGMRWTIVGTEEEGEGEEESMEYRLTFRGYLEPNSLR